MIDVAEVINSAGSRKVDSGLKILMNPIWFWLLARQFYKKILFTIEPPNFEWLLKGFGLC